MIDIWENAKKEQKILYFKNFQEPEVTWENVLNYAYNLSLIQDISLYDRIPKNTEAPSMLVQGSVLFNFGYLLFNHNNLFDTFHGIKDFMTKVNGGISGIGCQYYIDRTRCTCKSYWHMQALRFSMTNHEVSDHNDPYDVLYWQLLGTSRWIMNKDKEYLLEPGDVLYFNQEDSHQVLQDGPRAGIIIDRLKEE
jgi:mannose-6-phosphate isomerase-like protein (cupin superfamily)